MQHPDRARTTYDLTTLPEGSQLRSVYRCPRPEVSGRAGAAGRAHRRRHAARKAWHRLRGHANLRDHSGQLWERHHEWTNLRIEIDGTRLTVAVNRTEVLTLTEKAAPAAGNIGLFVDIGSESFFFNLEVTPN